MSKNEKDLDVVLKNAGLNVEILGVIASAAAAAINGDGGEKPPKKKRRDGLSDDMTLTDFYFAYYKPQISLPKNIDPGTIYCRELALEYWVKHTGNPPLAAIDKKVMSDFVVKMHREKAHGRHLSPATVRKHCMAIMSILNCAGPPSSQFRDAVGLINTPPGFPPIRVSIDVSWKTPGMEELEAILEACHVAKYPQIRGITPEAWWRNVYLFLYNTGIRHADIMDSRWCDIRVRNRVTVLVISAKREKTGEEKVIPLNTHALEILRQMPRGNPNHRIFRWNMSERTLYTQRSRIIEAAGLPNLKIGSFHAIRRMVATMIDDPQLVLGHTSAQTTRIHYTAISRKAHAFGRLEQPGRPVDKKEDSNES